MRKWRSTCKPHGANFPFKPLRMCRSRGSPSSPTHTQSLIRNLSHALTGDNLYCTPRHKLMSFIFCSDVFLLACALRALAAAVLVPVVRACNNHGNDLSDLFPPAFVNSQMVQAHSQAILEPVFPIRSLWMLASALSQLTFFFKNWR